MSLLDHYNPNSTFSQLDWDGLRSSKFGRTKVFLPKKDIINLGLDIPNQVGVRGRKHYGQQRSPQKQFRSIVRIIPPIQHWHPRPSFKKTYQMSFTSPHTRRQRGHHIPEFPVTDKGAAGIRTFYNSRIRDDNCKEYSVEDRMQRKTRVDQAQLRKTYFFKEKNPKQKFCLS